MAGSGISRLIFAGMVLTLGVANGAPPSITPSAAQAREVDASASITFSVVGGEAPEPNEEASCPPWEKDGESRYSWTNGGTLQVDPQHGTDKETLILVGDQPSYGDIKVRVLQDWVDGKGNSTTTESDWSGSVDVYFVEIETETVATVPSNRARLTVGSGEEVVISCAPATLTYQFSVDVGQVSTTTPSSAQFTAAIASGASPQKSTVTIEVESGPSLTIDFETLRPESLSAVKQLPEWQHIAPKGTAGVGMNLDITVHPTSVSFYRVETRELACPATGRSGYFLNVHTPHGHSAGEWRGVPMTHFLVDSAYYVTAAKPYEHGYFKWDIPVRWRVINTLTSGYSNIPDNTQEFTMHDSTGTMTVEKLGESATRVP